MLKAIIFDLDGTLLDTLTDLYNAVNYTLSELGEPLRTKKEVRSFLGDGISVLLKRSLTNKEFHSKALEIFLPYYDKNKAVETKPYDGIMNVVDELSKDFKLAIVSNKIDSGVQGLNQNMFNSLFPYSYGAKEGIPLKPSSDLINLCLDDMNVKNEECIYIGDSEVDYHTAKNANLKFVAVGWGFRDKEFLISLNPDYYIDEPSQLLGIINSLR